MTCLEKLGKHWVYKEHGHERKISDSAEFKWLRELIEDTKEAVGDRCAVAVRYSVGGDDGEAAELTAERRDRLEMLAELPDLWDININNYYQEMGVSRFF